jgi:hypothetical protein
MLVGPLLLHDKLMAQHLGKDSVSPDPKYGEEESTKAACADE